MRIFGDILPFIGWRVIHVDNEGHPTEEPSYYKADALEVEWLGAGATLFIGNVYPAGSD